VLVARSVPVGKYNVLAWSQITFLTNVTFLRRSIMSKRLYFLISFVLVLALSGLVQAATPLDVNNGSFEYDCNGNQIVSKETAPTGPGCIRGWTNSGNWFGATIWCGSPLYDPNDPNAQCNGVGATDGHVSAWIEGSGIYIYQVTDHVFEADRRYIVTFDAQGWGATFTPSLFYPLDGNFPDVNHIDVWGEEMLIDSEVPVGPDKYELDLELIFTTVPSQAYIGKQIGIKFFNASGGGYVFIDNVRLSYQPATQAGNPSPKNRAPDASILTDLSWVAGIEAAEHDVYFGTDFNNVNDANNSDPCGPGEIYRKRQGLASTTYNLPEGNLEFTKEYYWRIDEVNDPCLWKGDIWSFTTSDHVDVDDFDSYADTAALGAVWKDFYSNPSGLNRAEVFIESTDVNKFLDTGEQSMGYYYRNFTSQGKWYHSWAEANTVDLEVGTDWTVGGVKALVVNFCGDTANGQEATKDYTIADDQMWLELVDGGANAGIVRLPDMNDITDGSWHTWNISLQDPCLSGVDMNNVAKVYIGFGGAKGGAYKTIGAGSTDLIGDTVWFDDIGLYPPRCVPSYAEPKGDFDDDCVIDYLDLDNIARDWLVSGGWVSASPPDAGLLAGWYTLDEGINQTVVNYGTYGATHNGMLGNSPAVDACDPLWITNDPCAARERCLEFDGVTEYVEVPAFDFNTDTLTITAWVKRSGSQEIFAGLVVAADPCNGNTKAGLQFGSTPSWKSTNTLDYTWPDDGPPHTWEFQSDLLAPDGEWVFAALTVEPTVGTLYMYDGTMHRATNLANVHMVEEFDCVTDIAWNRSKGVDKRHFDGRIDEVRIYDYTLSQGEVLYLADPTGTFYQPLEDWRADIDGDDKVDVKDYVILANNWFDEILWPAP
jgi:hypothetical protein